MPTSETSLANLPEDPAALKELLRTALAERDRAEQRAQERQTLAHENVALEVQQRPRADALHTENLRLQLLLERFRKWYYSRKRRRRDAHVAFSTERRVGVG